MLIASTFVDYVFNLYTAHNCDVPDDEMTQELMVDEEPEEDYDEMPDLSDDKLSTMYTYEARGHQVPQCIMIKQ